MIKVTQDLKHTLQGKKHIQTVYFDKFGNSFFHAHKNLSKDKKKGDGKFYHRIKDQNVTIITEVNGKSVQRREHQFEVNPDHELVDQLSATEVLATPIADAPEFADKNTNAIYEKQAQEYAKLKAELDDLKNSQVDTDALKAEIEKLKQEKEQAAPSPKEDKAPKEKTEKVK